MVDFLIGLATDLTLIWYIYCTVGYVQTAINEDIMFDLRQTGLKDSIKTLLATASEHLDDNEYALSAPNPFILPSGISNYFPVRPM